MAEKRIFLILVDSDLNLYKASQVCTFPLERAHLCTDLYENLVGGQVLSDVDSVARLETFRPLKPTRLETFRARIL